MAPLPDFQSLSPEQKEGIYQYVEEKLKPLSVKFAHKALAYGATGPDLRPRRDISYEVYREKYWVYHLPVQILVIAIVCQYQVVASHSYANFHSIDDLRQVLLNRYRERSGISSIEPHLWKPLFDLKNSYWYKVLVDIIQESSLRAIVNAGPVGDGQTVWTNIVTEAEKSMTARISSQLLTAYLTTSKIRDGSWRGTDTAYLNQWNEQMRKLLEYSPTTHMTDDFKLTLLKNAVQDASHLASVESAYDVTTWLGSGAPGAIDYNGYMEVLLSAAQNHDAKILPTTRSQTRRANTHSSIPTESYDEEQYNIDTSIDNIWVNAHHSVLAHYSNGTRVSDDTWSKLLQDSRNIWMSLPIDDWKLILGASDSVSSITKTSSSTPSRSGFGRGHRTFARNRDKCKVMFMDRDSDDATTFTEPTTDCTDDDLVDDIMGQFDVDFDTLCVHVAERKHEELKAEGKHPHH
jgi:hypothetical protein